MSEVLKTLRNSKDNSKPYAFLAEAYGKSLCERQEKLLKGLFYLLCGNSPELNS